VIATILTMPQRSPEWIAARLGRVTGSTADAMLAQGKGKAESAGRRNLRVRLALERLMGVSQEDVYQSRDMLRGIELEDEAFRAYEAETGNVARKSGFLAHPTLLAGCSLDAEVDHFAGIVELKVPKSATHLEYLRGGVPLNYLRQVQHNLWISGAQWADFVSYDPRFPEGLRLKITRITMSDAERTAYELLVRLFLGEVDRELADVRTMAAAATASTGVAA
jgi:predicted phage-related endonuclease